MDDKTSDAVWVLLQCHTSDLRRRTLVVSTTTAFTDLATLAVRKVRHVEGGQVWGSGCMLLAKNLSLAMGI